MMIRRLRIARFRAIEWLELHPREFTVLLGPSNAGKSSLLAALDLLFHPGLGRRRPLSELDFYRRAPEPGFEIEAVFGNLPPDLVADTVEHLEGWSSATREVHPGPDGPGIEQVLRVRLRGDAELELAYSFAKDESDDARFPARLRRRIGWVYDGRAQDPSREFAFYQGSVLDRLLDGVDIDGPVDDLRAALGQGAEQINGAEALRSVLDGLGTDLRAMGLLEEQQSPTFEAGPVSRRELLQALRLAFPGPGDIAIPVERQGLGAQRMLLVATILRLSAGKHGSLIAAFDEPEQALEPVRQAQLVQMLRPIVANGGQLFLSTHSPEIVRGFQLDDLVLMPSPHQVRPLADLEVPAKRHYERWLDGGVVRGLFAPVPLLVEGVSDGPVLATFWHALAAAGEVPPMANLGVELIDCAGAELQPPMANLLAHAGRDVVVWVEQDRPETLRRLREEGHYAALLLHDPATEARNLERSLAGRVPLPALATALEALAEDRTASWDDQRQHLLGHLSHLPEDIRQPAKSATDVGGLLAALPEPTARELVAVVLAAGPSKNQHPPFEIKGARQSRLVAETILATSGVPAAYRRGIRKLVAWLQADDQPRFAELLMGEAPQPPPAECSDATGTP
ncbi:hypothetical protein AD006_29940 (plasmid) [Pseudonocardia sp. EC080610-09]|nr:hypothetical protein AD006_29940 [Pseudonocardia sp. EC080610-09]ALL85573.1 hypothetical protein AD017_31310 [Pseudonocardia sp. EC080619-01]